MTESTATGVAPDGQSPGGTTTETEYQRVQRSDEFQQLRRTFRRFVFPMTALFLVWYLVYVLLADYAHGFMSTKVWGNITVGLLFGLGQFVSTFAITMAYARWANDRLDPVADRLRDEIESAQAGTNREDVR